MSPLHLSNSWMRVSLSLRPKLRLSFRHSYFALLIAGKEDVEVFPFQFGCSKGSVVGSLATGRTYLPFFQCQGPLTAALSTPSGQRHLWSSCTCCRVFYGAFSRLQSCPTGLCPHTDWRQRTKLLLRLQRALRARDVSRFPRTDPAEFWDEYEAISMYCRIGNSL